MAFSWNCTHWECWAQSMWATRVGWSLDAVPISDVTIQRFCHDTISRYCKYPRYDTPRYRPSMKQQIIWYHRQCVCGVFNNSRRKISSRCVLIIKHVRMTLDKCLSNVYPSPNLTFSHNTKTEQHSCKEDSWPQIDGSITAMRKHGELLIRRCGIMVNIHW